MEVVSKPASRKTMDCPVIWPVVRAGNSPAGEFRNGDASVGGDQEDEEKMDTESPKIGKNER